jgi:CHAT domain-containing protein/Tfp pilus assembly protein PilF
MRPSSISLGLVLALGANLLLIPRSPGSFSYFNHLLFLPPANAQAVQPEDASLQDQLPGGQTVQPEDASLKDQPRPRVGPTNVIPNDASLEDQYPSVPSPAPASEDASLGDQNILLDSCASPSVQERFDQAENLRKQGQNQAALDQLETLRQGIFIPSPSESNSESNLDCQLLKAVVTNSLGLTYKAMGNYANALQSYQEALGFYQGAKDLQGQAISFNNIGEIESHQGHYPQALETYQKALDLFKGLRNLNGQAAILHNLGVVYAQFGQPDRALTSYQQALTQRRKLADVAGQASTLNNMGIVYGDLDNFAQAEQTYQQALTLKKQLNDQVGTASILNNLALLYVDLQQPERSPELLQQALEIYRSTGDVASEGNSLDSLGTVYAALGQYSQASESYQSGLSLVQQAGDRVVERQILTNLGHFFAQQSQTDLAISFYKQSVAVTETIRRDLSVLSLADQQSYTEAVSETYRSLADLLLAQSRIDEAQEILELLKIQEFKDYTSRSALSSPSDPKPPVPEVAINDGDLIALGIQLIACEQKRPFCADRESLQKRRDAANAEFNQQLSQFQSQIRIEQAKDPAHLDPAELSLAAKAIVQSQPDTVLIYPLVLEDKLWLVWVAQAGARGVVIQSKAVDVSRQKLGIAVQQFRRQLEDAGGNINVVKSISHRLYGWLIEPIRAELDANQVKHLVFSLDRVTRYIPMSALYDGEQYLMENFTISTILTAGLTDTHDRLSGDISQTPILAMGLSQSVEGAAPLPNVPAEVNSIVKDNPDDSDGIYPGSVWLNNQFNLNTLEDNLLNYRILHLATHGIFYSTHPEESYLLLGNGDKLSIPEIQTLEDLQGIHLVTLSACATGLGGPNAEGVEVAGMSYYFLISGAKAVMASLWEVSDASTSELMREFYRDWGTKTGEEPTTKPEALRQAQLTLLHNPDTAHPYYWSPFFLVGNGL